MIKHKSEYFKHVIFLIVLAINVYPIKFLYSPFISDELGTIATSELISGNDWAGFIEATGLAYYKYGTLLLYAPIIRIISSTVLQYRLMIFINALLISVVSIFVWSFLDNHTEITNKMDKALISFFISIIPGVMIWSKFVWSEAILCFMTWLSVLLLTTNTGEKAKNSLTPIFKGFFLGISAVYCYSVHVRGLVICIAVVMVLVISRIILHRWLVNPYSFFFTLAVLLAIDSKLSSLYKIALWGEGTTNNSTAGLLNIYLSQMISPKGVQTLLTTLAGWLCGFALSGYGLTLLGIVISGKITLSIITKKSLDQNSDGILILSLFIFILFLGSILVGILYFAPGDDGVYGILFGKSNRLDKLLYSRYLAYLMQPSSFLAITYFYKRKLDIRKQIAIIASNFILIKYIVSTFNTMFNTNGLAIGQLISIPLFIKSIGDGVAVYSDFSFRLTIAGAISILTLILIIHYSSTIRSVLIILSCISLLSFSFNMRYFVIQTQNFYNDGIQKVCKLIDIIPSNEDVVVIPRISRGVYAYHYALNSDNVSVRNSSESENQILVFESQNAAFKFLLDKSDYYAIQNEEFTGIVIKGESLISALKENGIE